MLVAMVTVACTEDVNTPPPSDPNTPEDPSGPGDATDPDDPNDPDDPKDDDDPKDPDDSEEDKVLYLELESDEVMRFSFEGGEGKLKWTIKEMVLEDDTRAEAAEPTTSTEQEWIKIDTAECSKFTVERNSELKREGIITISYLEQTIEVTIKQAGEQDVPLQKDMFSIDVQEVHAASAITQVTPVDSQMYYVMFLDDLSYFYHNNITSAEQLWDDDFAAFEGNAIKNGMSLKDYMVQSNIAFTGTTRIQWNRVRPGRESILYVYGVVFSEDGASYEPVTEIAWEIIKPESAPLQDVKFDVNVEVKGADVKLDIDATNWDGYYLVKIVDANDELYVTDESVFDDDYMATISDEWVDVYSSNLSAGRSMQDILDSVCYKGDKVLNVELTSYVLYSALVYPVEEYDGFVQVVGKPSYINFATEQVGQSDMDINIEVSNCYVRVTDLKITPSNPDESWILLITPTAYLPTGYDDTTLLDYALGEFSHYTYTFKGEVTTHLNTLYPNTEYIVVAFGYSGGVVTTGVCSKVFRTQKEGVCELEVTDVIVGGPYRVSDLYAYDPVTFEYYKPPYYYDSSHFVITIEVKTSEPTTDIFSDFIYKADYDYHGHDLMFYDLLIDTCEPYYFTTVEWEWMDTDIFANCYACAAAFDYKGDVTPMWMSDLYSWTMNDFRPIGEFIAKWEAQPGVMVMGLGADGAIVPMNKLR